MEIEIVRISAELPDQLIIRCHEITDDVREIVAFVKSRQGQLSGIRNEKQYEIPIPDICYIEVVDNRTFLYTNQKVYETRHKLYELEELLRQKHFLRVSKSTLLNLMKVKSIKPALNGRFTAILQTDEKVIISRKYVKSFKQAIKGEREEYGI